MARIFSTTGFGFSFNDLTGEVGAITGPATLSLSFAEDAPVILYSPISVPDPGILPAVATAGDEPLLVSINDLFYGSDIEASVGRMVWSEGTTDVLSFYVSDTVQYIFRLGGDPLPNPTTEAEANIFLSTVVQPIVLPPAGSGLAPGDNIALAALPGWTSIDASEATTFTVDAFSFIPGDPAPSGVQPAEITFVMTDPDAKLVYQSLGQVSDSGTPGAGPTIARAGFTEPAFTILVDGQPITSFDSDYEVFFARISTSTGAHDVLNIEFVETGRQYLISLGGFALPDGTDPAAVAAFFSSITSVDPIPAGFGAPGEEISISGLPGAIEGGGPLPEVTGDPGVLEFSGFKVVFSGEDVASTETTTFKVALPATDAFFNYVLTGVVIDDKPLVDIRGTEPYAALLDDLALIEDIDASIVRIVSNGDAYDFLMFLDLANNTEYLFQIGGATAVNLGTLTEVNTFIDGVTSVGVIPDGPLRPGANFQFSESPYLIGTNSDPQIIEGGDFTRVPGSNSANYGRGDNTEGSLTILNGADLTLNATGAVGPFMSVGRGAGAVGTVIVAGEGSTLSLVAGGGTAAEQGSSVSIGRSDGTGYLRVLEGGRFEITDPDGTSAGPDLGGAELFQVGRGGEGYVDIVGGSIAITGTSARTTIGQGVGGEGRLYVEDGTFRVESTTDDAAVLRVGYENGFGELFLEENARVFVQAGEGGTARLEVGLQTGGASEGVIDITGARSSLIVVGGGGSEFVVIDIGTGANGVEGRGFVNVTGGAEFGALNLGFTLNDDMIQSANGTGGAAEMNIGRNSGAAGIGKVVANNGGEIFVAAIDEASLTIGDGPGSNGWLEIENSSALRVLSSDDMASIDIGTGDGGSVDGSIGRMFVRGEAEVRGARGAEINIGRLDGNSGELTLEQGGTLWITGETNFTYLEIGTLGATGTATLRSGGRIDADGANSRLFIGDIGVDSVGNLLLNGAETRITGFAGTVVGDDGGTGTMRVENGAAAILGRVDSGENNFISVGGGGGSGDLTIENARVSLQGANGDFEAYTVIGSDQGLGNATITGQRATNPDAAHGFIQIAGGNNSASVIDIGRGDGSTGNADVSGAFFGVQNTGSTFGAEGALDVIDLPGDGGSAMLRVGFDFSVGSVNGTDADIFVRGGGTEGATVLVGAEGGTGVVVMTGEGVLEVDGGTGAAVLSVGSGGGIGTLDLSGSNTIQITGTGSGQFNIGTGDNSDGLVTVTGAGSLIAAEGSDIRIAAEGAGNFGLLHIVSGASGLADSVTVGSAGTGTATDGTGLLVLNAGLLTAGTVTIAATGTLAGTGSITGDVTITGALNVGDTWDLLSDPDGVTSGKGALNIVGNLTQTAGEAQFDLGAGAGDFLNVNGALSFTDTAFNITYDGTLPALGYEVQLASAFGGVTLGSGTSLLSSFDSVAGATQRLEVREGTELWFITEAPATVTLSGMVAIREVSPGSINPAGTLVTFTEANGTVHTDTTDATGAFSFALNTGTVGTLDLVRTYSPPSSGGSDTALSIFDVLDLFRLVAGDPATPIDRADIIAGDFNQTGQTNITDVLDLFRFVGTGAGPASPKYVFVESDDDLATVTVGTVPPPVASFDVAAITSDTSLNFLGILGGDMQGHLV